MFNQGPTLVSSSFALSFFFPLVWPDFLSLLSFWSLDEFERQPFELLHLDVYTRVCGFNGIFEVCAETLSALGCNFVYTTSCKVTRVKTTKFEKCNSISSSGGTNSTAVCVVLASSWKVSTEKTGAMSLPGNKVCAMN